MAGGLSASEPAGTGDSHDPATTMFLRLLFLFTALPLLELWLLLAIGSRVGVVATVALVFGTGVLGAWLARSQGLSTWRRLQTEMAAGRLPSDALVDGLLILIAGAVLLTPGLLTDLAGFFLLTPAGRQVVRRAVVRSFRHRMRRSDGRVIVVEQHELR